MTDDQHNADAVAAAVLGHLISGATDDLTRRGAHTARGIGAIRAHDPAFDEPAFLTRVQAVVLQVKRAITEQNPMLDRQVCGDSLWDAQQAQMEADRVAGRRRVIEAVRVTGVRTYVASSDGVYDTIAVRVIYQARAYTVGPRHRLVDGNRRTARAFNEIWWLQRSAAATTSGFGTLDQRCPGCRAPLQLGADGACPYCHISVSSGVHDWVVVRIEQEGSERWTPDGSQGAGATRNGISAGLVIAILASCLAFAVVLGGTAYGVVQRSRTSASPSSRSVSQLAASSPGGASSVTFPTGVVAAAPAGPSHLAVHVLSSDPLRITGAGTVDVGEDPQGCAARGASGTAIPASYPVTFDSGAAGAYVLHITSIPPPVLPGVYRLAGADFSVSLTGTPDADTFSLQSGGLLLLVVRADGSGRLDFGGLKGPGHSQPLQGEMDWICRTG